MYNHVKDYIRKNHMVEPGCTILAGVSGGGDSMAMLDLLRRCREEMSFSLYVVHIHHGIRGKEAERDCALVEDTCKEWKIPCRTYRYPVPELAAKWHMGIEETGRAVRREAFRDETERLGLLPEQVRIALAHNRNDLAETMLHNLARGTGLRGLCTMRPAENGIIRPVLCLGKHEIDDYLKEQRIPYITDSSNLTDDYTRNRIRHHILPLMEQEVNKKTAVHMAETAGFLMQAEDYLTGKGRSLLDSCVQRKNGYILGEDFFAAEPVLCAYGILQAFENLSGKRKDFSSFHVKMVLELYGMQTGRHGDLPCGLYADRIYEGVFLGKMRENADSDKDTEKNKQTYWKLPANGELTCPLGTFRTCIFPYEGQKIEEKKCTKWLDYDRIKDELCVRTRMQGDYLVVNREGSRKKLSRVMIDDKIPGELRESIPLVAAGEEILWIAGGRMNERYKITPGTCHVLELQYQGGKENE